MPLDIPRKQNYTIMCRPKRLRNDVLKHTQMIQRTDFSDFYTLYSSLLRPHCDRPNTFLRLSFKLY